MPSKETSEGAGEMHIPNYTMLDFGFSQGEEASYKDRLSGAENVHIPNYTMLDFGFPEGTRIAGNPQSR
jgi:hypothetical protein